MPSFYKVHMLVKIEPHPDLHSGNSVPWQHKYFGLCGYKGVAPNAITKQGKKVTCLLCKKKMRANNASSGRGGTLPKSGEYKVEWVDADTVQLTPRR